MSTIDAQNALLARLQAMPSAPDIAYPNGPVVDAKPRIVVQFPNAAQATATVSGQTQGTAAMVCRIETEQHRFAGEANTIAGQIIAQFPVGLVTDGVKVEQAPTIQAHFETDGAYHLPVTVSGKFEF